MRCGRLFVVVLALGLAPALARAQPPGPSDNAVLLPPEFPDDVIKGPNTTREHYGEWSISGGVLFLEPVFASNPAFSVSSAGGNITRQVDFSQHLTASPDVWLSYTSERGWGIRLRWFEFDSTASASYFTAPGETVRGASFLPIGQAPLAGAALASSQLRMNVADLQGTWTSESAFWQHVVGFGVRYTALSEDYQAALGNPGAATGLASHHDFSGAGPSLSLETKRRLGETGFAIYGQAYGAVLFGNMNENYLATSGGVLQAFTHNATDVLPVAESEVGVEYQRSFGRAKAFVQAGLNGQVWWGAGNASNIDAPGASSASHGNLGLIGAAVRVGVRY